MKEELEKQLFDKYPKIFRQKDLGMHETCMCWGIACGDGWYPFIDELCSIIQKYIDEQKIEQIEAVQVKEKFGRLRFYTNYYDEQIEKFIAEAEKKCYTVCEICGSTEDIRPTKGWISYLCKTCRVERS